MRRLSALVALVALSRFSLSGAVGCMHTAEAEAHPHDITATVGAAAHDHAASDPDGHDTACRNAQHGSCPAMSSCVNAVLPESWVRASGPRAAQRVAVAERERAPQPPRGPDPPPPRA